MDVYGSNTSHSSSARTISQAALATSGTAPGNALLIQWDNATPASEVLQAYNAVCEELLVRGFNRPGAGTVICVP